MDAEEELPLAVLFERASRVADAADRLNPGEVRQADALRSAADAARRAEAAADRLALFSPNEQADDLPTSSLRYLLLPYHRGQLEAAAAPCDPTRRRAALEVAQQHLSRYLERCQQYGLLGPSGASLAAAVAAAAASGGMEQITVPLDPNSKRMAKIQRFKREKELRQQLERLRSRLHGGGGGRGGDDGDDGDGGGDEEDERQMWMSTIELAALKAAEMSSSLQEEAAILQHMANVPEEDRRLRGSQREPLPELMQQLGAALANLQGASGSQGERARMAAEVFRPSHNLPTMSLRQFAEQEMLQAEEAAERQRQAEARRDAADPDAQEDDDREVSRVRAMDDFKDENPRGWGNSKLRPCG